MDDQEGSKNGWQAPGLTADEFVFIAAELGLSGAKSDPEEFSDDWEWEWVDYRRVRKWMMRLRKDFKLDDNNNINKKKNESA